MVFFPIQDLFLKRKKSQPLFRKAIAVRLIFKKHNLDINEKILVYLWDQIYI